MKVLFYILTLMIAAQLSFGVNKPSFAQKAPDHIIKEDEPAHIKVNVLITDERQDHTISLANIEDVIKKDLRKEFPSANLHFASRINQLKKSGDNINIMIRAKSIQKEQKLNKSVFAVHYKVMIYDVSKTPIMIRDGNVKFDMDLTANEDESKILEQTVGITNLRLAEFLRRNISHKSFRKKAAQTN